MITDIKEAVKLATPYERKLISYKGKDASGIRSKFSTYVTLICRALNDGWMPDYGNLNGYKYFPYFIWDPKKASFIYCDSVDWDSSVYATGAPCQALKNRELAIHAATHFLKYYQGMFYMPPANKNKKK